jgi:hypothetical protein
MSFFLYSDLVEFGEPIFPFFNFFFSLSLSFIYLFIPISKKNKGKPLHNRIPPIAVQT